MKKKKHKGILSFYTCVIINDNHDVWFLKYGVQWTEISFIQDHFLPFFTPSPFNNLKNQNFEKMKTMPGDIIFYKSVPKIMIICYAVSEIQCMTNVALFFILGYFLHSPPPLEML